jgi:hypothetical protein
MVPLRHTGRLRFAHYDAGLKSNAAHRGNQIVFYRRQNNLAHAFRVMLGAASAALALIAASSPAAAQSHGGIFETLFGRPWSNGPSAYADPSSSSPFKWFGSRPAETPPADVGGPIAYCVRLCDGRFYPIQHLSAVSPVQACSASCPASQTRIYNGEAIDNAVAVDGKHYADLSTAFTYRGKIVPGCTCNGRDAFGLANTPIEDDPTLRPGDIVATNDGLMAYNGGAPGTKAQAGNFTPISSYSGLSAELRRRLTETKVAPTSPAVPAEVKQRAAVPADSSAHRNKRVQLDR